MLRVRERQAMWERPPQNQALNVGQSLPPVCLKKIFPVCIFSRNSFLKFFGTASPENFVVNRHTILKPDLFIHTVALQFLSQFCDNTHQTVRDFFM